MNLPFFSAAIVLALAAAPARAQRPGDLVSAEPVVDTPAGMQAWKITYWTTDARDRLSRVTGMVVAPREALPSTAREAPPSTAREALPSAPREAPPSAARKATPTVPRDILAWTHGTAGVAARCAPSLSSVFWSHSPGLGGVRQGYVVVAPDYPGLGSAGVHPYLVGQDTGRSVLDAVRAARSIPAAAAGKRFAVWGESQGGHAALWTGQLARSYAPDLKLVGVAAAAPVTDLVANLRQVPNKAVGALLTSFIGYSWADHYGAPLATLGGPQTQVIMTRLARNNCIEPGTRPKFSTMAGILTMQSRLKGKDLGAIAPWGRLARLNSPTGQDFGVPLLIAQNPNDDLVAPDVTRAHVRALCRSGARVRYLPISGAGHATSGRDSADATLAWIAERFAGLPAPRDCRGL